LFLALNCLQEEKKWNDLARVMARLRETACCIISAALLVLNFTRSLRASLFLFLLRLFCWGCGVDPI